jgi:hypothetical protein
LGKSPSSHVAGLLQSPTDRPTERFVGNPLPRRSLIVGVCNVKAPGDRNIQVDDVCIRAPATPDCIEKPY